MKYRPEIDGLRAVAITLVVVFHFVPQWASGGYIGVDVFFVISGYLITALILERLEIDRFTLVGFYRARIHRLFPALILVMLSCLIWGWFALLPTDYTRLGRHITSTLAFFENFRLKGESGYFDADILSKPLAHMWSLSIEEQFYLLFPLLLMGFKARGKWMLPMVASLWAISFGLSLWGIGIDPVGGYFLPWMRSWELLSGSLLVFVSDRLSWQRSSWGNVLAGLGLALIFSSAFLLNQNSPFPGALALPPVLGAGLILWIGRSSTLIRALLANPVTVWVGRISYPLYLWHWPLLASLHMEQGAEAESFSLAAMAGLSIVLAAITYHGVEKPLNVLKSKVATQVTLLVLAVFVAISGVVVTKAKGFPARFPDMPLELAIEKPPFPKEWRFGRCFLISTQTFKDYAGECFGEDLKPALDGASSGPRILLWGDSYAAHLYPGLFKEWGQRAKITQLTAMACPPMDGISIREYPNCQSNFDGVLNYLKTHSFDTIIFAANWDGLLKRNGPELLEATLKKLRALGVRNLVIYGPPPLWQKPLPSLMMIEFVKHKDQDLPVRLKATQSEKTLTNEIWLRDLAKTYQFRYVSLFAPLCDDSGCLALSDGHLTSLDDGHLTKAGSEALFECLPCLDGGC